MSDKYDAEVTIRFRVPFGVDRNTAKEFASNLGSHFVNCLSSEPGNCRYEGNVELAGYCVQDIRAVNERIVKSEEKKGGTTA